MTACHTRHALARHADTLQAAPLAPDGSPGSVYATRRPLPSRNQTDGHIGRGSTAQRSARPLYTQEAQVRAPVEPRSPVCGRATLHKPDV